MAADTQKLCFICHSIRDAGFISTLTIKDMSRLGRDYLQVGYYTETYFPDRDICFIAMNDYEAEGTGKNRTQRIAIYCRFVGYLELPAGKINPHYTADLRRGVAIEYVPKQPA